MSKIRFSHSFHKGSVSDSGHQISANLVFDKVIEPLNDLLSKLRKAVSLNTRSITFGVSGKPSNFNEEGLKSVETCLSDSEQAITPRQNETPLHQDEIQSPGFRN